MDPKRNVFENNEQANKNETNWNVKISGPDGSVSTNYASSVTFLFMAPYSSKVDILLSKKDLINWYMVVIQS